MDILTITIIMLNLSAFFKKIYYRYKTGSINKSDVDGWVIILGFFLYPAIVFPLLPVMGYEHNTNHIMIYINKAVLYLIIFNMTVLLEFSGYLRPKNKEENPILYYITLTLDSICFFGYGAGLPAMFLMLVLQ